MGNKVTIIGSGSVGSTIAYTMAVQGTASEIVMIDINTEKSLGEALDIRQGIPFYNSANVYAGSYANAEGSDIVIIRKSAWECCECHGHTYHFSDGCKPCKFT
jgi:L-lactate dehydrogenase